MRRLTILVAICFAALWNAAAQDALDGAVWGIYARDLTGNVITSRNENVRMVPASNLKLVTTGTALHAFGPGYRFRTGLGYTGSIGADGTLDGDLYIIGGGDPTIGSGDSLALSAEALFWKWKTILRDHGIERIHGRIIGDSQAWEGGQEHIDWGFADMSTYYGTGSGALCFYENAVDVEVWATAVGEPVGMRQVYPETPWMHISNQGVTGPAGSGNSLYLFTTDLAPYAQMRGTYASDRRPKVEHTSNKYGDLTCAYYFWKNLKATGWEVSGGYARVDNAGCIAGPDFVPDGKAGKPVEIGFTEGPQLKDIVKITNFRSDNFYAESLLRAMGEASCGKACYDSCLVAQSVVLKDLGADPAPVIIVDGSGLSRQNALTPKWLADYLCAMTRSEAFPAFLESIPAPGQGTLAGISFPGSAMVRMKSGSMGGVLCYSGYVLDAQGRPRIAFSAFAGNANAGTARLREALIQKIRIFVD